MKDIFIEKGIEDKYSYFIAWKNRNGINFKTLDKYLDMFLDLGTRTNTKIESECYGFRAKNIKMLFNKIGMLEYYRSFMVWKSRNTDELKDYTLEQMISRYLTLAQGNITRNTIIYDGVMYKNIKELFQEKGISNMYPKYTTFKFKNKHLNLRNEEYIKLFMKEYKIER